MEGERLWAPWRLGYVQGGETGAPEARVDPRAWRPGAEPRCFLCRAASVATDHGRDVGVLERTDHSVVLLNRFPYSNGHLLVAPLDHEATLGGVPPAGLLDLQTCIVRWCDVIAGSMQAQGFNIGLNLGAVSGAGCPGHLHWHVVPRWPGDVNFMATVAGVRVLPQALDALWDQLTSAAGHSP